jgi:hypothetical protein
MVPTEPPTDYTKILLSQAQDCSSDSAARTRFGGPTSSKTKICDTPAAPHPPALPPFSSAPCCPGTAPYRAGPGIPGDHPVATTPGPHFCGGAPLAGAPPAVRHRAMGLPSERPFSAFFLFPNIFDRFSAHAIRSRLFLGFPQHGHAMRRSWRRSPIEPFSGFDRPGPCAGRRSSLFQDSPS